MPITYTCDRCGQPFTPGLDDQTFILNGWVVTVRAVGTLLDPSCRALIATTGTTTTVITPASQQAVTPPPPQ